MKSMQKGFTLIELMIVVAIIAILAAIAIPQYQAYVIRSQVSRVMGEVGDQKVVVEDCLNNGYTTVPTANTSCVSTASSSDLLTEPSVPTFSTLSGTAKSYIEGEFGRHANNAIANDKLEWARSASGSWTCTTDVPTQYAPASCPNGTVD
jgi:type IV pilus assembly protein PilA